MAFEGIQDLWYTLRGELDHESKNLIKEATGHKVDNLVELAEIGMSIYAGKVASKKITGKLGEESEKLSGLLKKTRKPVSIATRTKRLVKKFMPKKRYRKFKVVDVEELTRKQCLKPNIQLFAEDIEKEMSVTSKSILKNAELPVTGKIRYIPPETWSPSQPLPRINGGYIDKFGNIWTKGPTRTAGEAFEWDVQLSKTGKNKMGWLSRDGSHLNVSLKGRITHK